MSAPRSMLGVAALALSGFVLDRLSKWYVLDKLDLDAACPAGGVCRAGLVDVYPPYLRLTMAWNPGINFGLFGHHSDIMRFGLILFALAASVGLFIYARRRPWDGWSRWGAGLAIGGALGNAWDRWVYGYVADYLNMSCCGIRNPYAFNVADILIFAGMALLIVGAGREDPQAV